MSARRLPVVLLLAFLLAGCTQADPGSGPSGASGGSSFQASCPSWVRYPHKAAIVQPGDPLQWYTDSNGQSRHDVDKWDFKPPYDSTGKPTRGDGFGTALTTWEGHPLDFVVFDFTATSPANRSATRLEVLDAVVHLEFFREIDGQPGEQLLAYDLAKGPSSAKATWDFASDPATGYGMFNVSLRVDLAPIDADPDPSAVFAYWSWEPDQDGDEHSPSVLRRGYAPDLWFRTCSKDGTRV